MKAEVGVSWRPQCLRCGQPFEDPQILRIMIGGIACDLALYV